MTKRVSPTLYPFQIVGKNAILDGFNNNVYISKDEYIVKTNSFLLCDEMGLGKTIQAQTALVENLSINVDTVTNPILIVCPSAITHVWKDNDGMFSDVYIYKKGFNFSDNLTPKSVVIISYTALANAFKRHLSNLSTYENERLLKICGKSMLKKYSDGNFADEMSIFLRKWGHIVMDEIHVIKSPNSVKTRACGAIQATYRLGLTGTPIMNGGSDLLCILKYGLGLFNVNWCTVELYPSGDYCKSLLKATVLCRSKSDIGFVKKHKVSCQDVFVSWDNYDKSRKEYQAVKHDTLKLLETADSDDSNVKLVFFAKLQRLRQICLIPKLNEFEKFYKTYTGKIVVFSTYRTFFENIMSKWLIERNIGFKLFAGGCKKKQADALNQFNKNDAIQVLMVVKSAGAVGLNLQHTSSAIIMLDPHFNRALDFQAESRVDRIGQTNDVIIKRYYMKGSVDIAMLKLQETKEKCLNLDKLSLKVGTMHLKMYDTV